MHFLVFSHLPFLLNRLPEKPKKDFRDSEVYKLISENEATKRAEDARRAEEAADTKLTGSNPSKQSLSFKVLQWMTDTEKPVEDLQDTPTGTYSLHIINSLNLNIELSAFSLSDGKAFIHFKKSLSIFQNSSFSFSQKFCLLILLSFQKLLFIIMYICIQECIETFLKKLGKLIKKGREEQVK